MRTLPTDSCSASSLMLRSGSKRRKPTTNCWQANEPPRSHLCARLSIGRETERRGAEWCLRATAAPASSVTLSLSPSARPPPCRLLRGCETMAAFGAKADLTRKAQDGRFWTQSGHRSAALRTPYLIDVEADGVGYTWRRLYNVRSSIVIAAADFPCSPPVR